MDTPAITHGSTSGTAASPATKTNADLVVEILQQVGVQRLFGMPGGGSNADVIEAAARAGLPFSLAQTETGSAFMAIAQAEITGMPGACISTIGPGAASVMNGVAHANLECVPLIVVTDCQPTTADEVVQHQTIRQGEMLMPLVKRAEKPTAKEAVSALERIFESVLALPAGPVHLDLSSEVTSAATREELTCKKRLSPSPARTAVPSEVQASLRGTQRPVFLIGLGARTVTISEAIRTHCCARGIPALVTYKAKGVVPDRNPWFAGVLTNGALERDILEQADVFIAVGLDPTEFMRPWSFPQPLISITAWPLERRQIRGAIELVGDVVSILHAVVASLPKTLWDERDIQRSAAAQRERMRPSPQGPLLQPHRVVELVAETYPGARITVDAGAHMFPVMSLWPAEESCDILISNCLATMGFALPAAIGASLLDPSRPVVAFTGDGGLLMCLGELRTVARENLPLRVIVFDDRELSLIRIKQVQKGYRTDRLAMGEMDWCLVGQGMGLASFVADDESSLRTQLQRTANHKGPVLIGARIDASTYPYLIRTLRG